MDHILILCLERISSFLAITKVFILMSVSRKWQDAAIRGLLKRDTIIFHDPGYHLDRTIVSPMDTITVKKDMHPICISISKWMSLKTLVVYTDRPDDAIISLVTSNSATLETLIMPADITFTVSFPLLTKLHCHHVDPHTVHKCPSLTEVGVNDQRCPSLLANLNGQKIRMLSFQKDVLPTREPEFILTVSNMMHLENVTVLHLHIWLKEIRGLQPLVILFQRLNKLLELQLSLCGRKFDLGPVIDSLVSNNPQMKHLHLIGMRITDEGLISLSQLAHLIYIKLCPDSDELVTTDGIMRFLRGNSRSSLRFCCLCRNAKMYVWLIEKEIDRIQDEVGKELEREQDEINCIHYTWE